MKRFLRAIMLLACSLLVAVTAISQVKNNVVKLHAYIQQSVATDASGKPISNAVDYLHQLFAETAGKILPQWNVVYTNYGVFAVQPEEIIAGKYTVGKLKSNANKVMIAAKRGNRLWQLTLVPMKAAIPANIAALLKKNDMVVITGWNGKRFTHTVVKETELETIYQ